MVFRNGKDGIHQNIRGIPSGDGRIERREHTLSPCWCGDKCGEKPKTLLRRAQEKISSLFD
jgi:hypothetical protein